eukprot:CAMPEP_0174863512 /NCGR_PEP_ID=MMETSP1114-20130205/56379_1 /TAXON_ID=312471 /ORGANISM="Neobodo designis, Strain CCAP 1951/1" /LENGTH=73 /DNA_ID=CAMNT_0016098579 /DNA_START=29 /DNA_END=246 /DNA_ORIENTATION=+
MSDTPTAEDPQQRPAEDPEPQPADAPADTEEPSEEDRELQAAVAALEDELHDLDVAHAEAVEETHLRANAEER